jgi:signal transduction histidine kinase
MADSLRILLVDDDHVDRMAVKRLLKQAALASEVVECADRDSAVDAVRRQAFDCVLLDYRLPKTDGVELLRDLRAAGDDVPVVALTGQGDEVVAVELMKAGAADYLNKNGLTSERLERSLRYAIALHRADEERRLLLEREQQARLQAQAANRAKDEFLATLSHELRTPLNAILGWAQLLAGGQLDAKSSRRAIEIIERNTRLQAQLIDDLLDISRITTGKLRLELKTVTARSILEAAIESALPAASAKGVRLVPQLPGGDESLSCDPARMQQVVWNLLSNAVKFTPAGGQVTLSSRREGDRMIVEVSDTGIGIGTEFLPHVFDRFRQQDAAITRRHGGLGLGLSIVRHLVELHGGSIHASSEGQGTGATFTVVVPLAPVLTDTASAFEDEDTPAESPENLVSLEGLHVLVVDNEADARSLVSAILQGRGADVTAVESAHEAIEAIRTHRPDVLLSDIGMPGEDGYALIRKVRQLRPTEPLLPAAAVTAYASAGDRAQAILAGYQAHLSKPIKPSELTAVVAALAKGVAKK